MQVPTGLMQLLMSIYNAAKIYFCAFGKCEYVCKVTSGVIHGCPLSGTLFVLATQAILAHLHKVLHEHAQMTLVAAISPCGIYN
eukprot:6379381-Karenia_brevis.AAC.1